MLTGPGTGSRAPEAPPRTHLAGLSVERLDHHAAEAQDAASAAAGCQKLLDHRLVLLLQGQHPVSSTQLWGTGMNDVMIDHRLFQWL